MKYKHSAKPRDYNLSFMPDYTNFRMNSLPNEILMEIKFFKKT